MNFFGNTKALATNTSRIQVSRTYNKNGNHENLSNDSRNETLNNKNHKEFYKMIKIEAKSF